MSGLFAGIDLGTTFTAAAVARGADSPEMISLGPAGAAIPSVLYLRDDGSVATGSAAVQRAVTEPERVAREFKRRIGDPAPVFMAGTPMAAHLLMGRLLEWVTDRIAEREGEEPTHTVITHPANWGDYKRDYLRQAVDRAGLGSWSTLTEPEAAAIHYATRDRVEPGGIVAVYDLGGGTFDAAVMRHAEDGFEIIGRPHGIENLGGVDFDQAVFNHVVTRLSHHLDTLDSSDRQVVAALKRLQADAEAAKVALSSEPDTAIPVSLPRLLTTVRLTREEFEEMIRPTIDETIDSLRHALDDAGVEPDDLAKVLLVGGASRIPLVAQMVTHALGRPVAVDTDPKHAIALGAALHARLNHAQGETTAAAEVLSVSGVTEPEPTDPTEDSAESDTTTTDHTDGDQETDKGRDEPSDTNRKPFTAAEESDEAWWRRSWIAAGVLGLALVVVGTTLVARDGGGEDPVAATTAASNTATTANAFTDDTNPADSTGTTTTVTNVAVTSVAASQSVGLLFVSDRDGDRDLYMMDPDGSNVTKLTDEPGDESSPSLSPDATRIAFESDQNGTNDIYVMDVDGSNLTRLTDEPGADSDPTWSPDGSHIAFVSDRNGEDAIYIMNADGSGVTQLETRGFRPAWSPDGTRIAYHSDRDGSIDIYVMNADGSNVTRLTDEVGNDYSPAWSPDGTRIVFSSDRNDELGESNIYVMDADGTDIAQLTDDDGYDRFPVWSPDGTRIAYQSARGAGYDIYTMASDGSDISQLTTEPGEDLVPVWFSIPDPNATTPEVVETKLAFVSDREGDDDVHVIDADGSDLTRLTSDPGGDYDPTWSPDGNRIAFASDRDGDRDLYVMDADGTDLTQLTFDPGDDFDPKWSPDGNRIAFVSNRDEKSAIYVIDADGSNLSRLTDAAGSDSSPSWSPDGTRIAFISDRDGVPWGPSDLDLVSRSIYVIDADGSNLSRVTVAAGHDSSPSWSPDGTRIAFTSFREVARFSTDRGLYIIDADGSDLSQLTSDRSDSNPVWSPDGTRIAFSDTDDIYIIDADGSNLTQLTSSPGDDYVPAWSPDGSRIAFASDREGDFDIYVMDADGTNLTQLTSSPGDDFDPAWAPLESSD